MEILTNEKMGVRLWEIRKKKNISVKELSLISGISETVVYNLEENRQYFTVDHANKLAEALGLYIEELLFTQVPVAYSGHTEIDKKAIGKNLDSMIKKSRITIEKFVEIFNNYREEDTNLLQKGFNIPPEKMFSRSTLFRWKNKENSNIPLRYIYIICRILKIDAEILLFGETKQ